MAFPNTKRYFLRFRHSDSGLTPSFLYFKNASSFANITPPTISEVIGVGLGDGTYYFDWTWSTATDPDIIFEVDGGASIPTEEIRYISDALSPRDVYLDEPTSQVGTDVWNDTTTYTSPKKGFYLPEIGAFGDSISTQSIFGWLDAIAGSGFVSASDSLVALSTNSGITPTQVANAVWDALLTGHTISGSFGLTLGSTILGYTQRAVGLLHENSVLDLTSFDSNNNLLSGRMRIYSSAADAVAAQAASPGPYTTNMIAQYAITATYTGSNLTTYLVDRTA